MTTLDYQWPMHLLPFQLLLLPVPQLHRSMPKNPTLRLPRLLQ
jgi:hypothetical protein